MRCSVSISDAGGANGEIPADPLFVGTGGDIRAGERRGAGAESSAGGGGGCHSKWRGLLSRGGPRAGGRPDKDQIGPGAKSVDICLLLRSLVAENISGNSGWPDSTHAPGSFLFRNRPRRPAIYLARHAGMAGFPR